MTFADVDRGRFGPTPWIAGGLAVLAAVWVVWAVRLPLVRHVPGTESFYAAVGWPVDTLGLTLGAVRSVLAADGAERTLTVEGTIGNRWTTARPVPDLSLTVVDRQGAALYRWTAPAERRSLDPRETVAFRVRLASPPRDAHDVVVSFAPSP